MSFNDLLVQTVEVSRRVQQQLGVKSYYQVVEASLKCNIQPVTSEYAAVTGMVFGRSYNAYFNLGADIQINDRVVDQDGKEYYVTGTAKRNYGYSQPHLTVQLGEQSRGGSDQ